MLMTGLDPITQVAQVFLKEISRALSPLVLFCSLDHISVCSLSPFLSFRRELFGVTVLRPKLRLAALRFLLDSAPGGESAPPLKYP